MLGRITGPGFNYLRNQKNKKELAEKAADLVSFAWLRQDNSEASLLKPRLTHKTPSITSQTQAERIILDISRHVMSQKTIDTKSRVEVGREILSHVNQSYTTDPNRYEMGNILCTQFGVPSAEAFTLVEVDTDSIWDTISNPENWVPERRELHEKIHETRLKGIEALSQAVSKESGIQPNTWIAQRGGSGSGKTSSLIQMLGSIPTDLLAYVINPDLVKSALIGLDVHRDSNGYKKLTHASVHHEGSELMHRTAMAAKTESTHLLIEDARLADESAIDLLFQTAVNTQRVVTVNDHETAKEIAFLAILGRPVGGDDPIVPWFAFKDGFIGSSKSRHALISRLHEPVIQTYNLFANTDGNQILVATYNKGRLEIFNNKLYDHVRELADHAETEIETFGETILTDTSIAKILEFSPEKFKVKNQARLELHKGKTVKEVMNERASLIESDLKIEEL